MTWFPWKYLIRRAARKHGFLDPITLVSRLRRFAQPSSVTEPIELIRAGVAFHARGLINTRAIQHNLDWVWPFWVEKQFDPNSESFIPRAFSVTHINLTHRNWTAVGVPDFEAWPIVDPRGLVTPMWDGWSLDVWVLRDDGRALLPSRAEEVRQEQAESESSLCVRTITQANDVELATAVFVCMSEDVPVCRLTAEVRAASSGWLVLALRPYNPEGVSFINTISFDQAEHSWSVNRSESVQFHSQPDRIFMSCYKDGDVFHKLVSGSESAKVHCGIGMATAAAVFRIDGGNAKCPWRRGVDIPLAEHGTKRRAARRLARITAWPDALKNTASLEIPHERFKKLYDAAVRTLILLSPDWAYPGPYTYKRFWYRDAVFMAHALLGMNAVGRVRRLLDHFPAKQHLTGYFHSQEGEWDSNGEVLWAFAKYCSLTKTEPPREWIPVLARGGDWICRERLTREKDQLHTGLLPAGFSAEHFGNIDYYYWDDYWSVAGLEGAARLLRGCGDVKRAEKWEKAARDLTDSIRRSLEQSRHIRSCDGIPASPYRRMDAGAVGALCAGYPLQILPPRDERLLATADFLMDECLVKGAFFQDMIHSGLNAYLTLHLAQVLLRAGDARFTGLIRAVADTASATGHWPEAIHPRTGGGCMGDGQHAWAAAEWVMMMRALFVREEGDRLVLGSGLSVEWLRTRTVLRFGPTPTSSGVLTVEVRGTDGGAEVLWDGTWFSEAPCIEVALPHHEAVTINHAEASGSRCVNVKH
ncbi:MAG: hypothetical protein K9N51_01630 [Candidatus Pacebacteria bacterium]|nr:hypothetical protein [Candidatus Paceibacterota bacterium]